MKEINEFTPIGTFCNKCRQVMCLCEPMKQNNEKVAVEIEAQRWLLDKRLGNSIINNKHSYYYVSDALIEFTATKDARILELESQIKLLEIQLKSSKQDVQNLKDILDSHEMEY